MQKSEFIHAITHVSNEAYDTIVNIVENSDFIGEVNINLESLIDGLRKATNLIDDLKLNLDEKFTEPPTIVSDVVKLARAFCVELSDNMSPAELTDAVTLNASAAYQDGVCATHNYCDSNQCMLDAFTKAMGREYTLFDDEIPESKAQSDIDKRLTATAWSLARAWNFNADNFNF